MTFTEYNYTRPDLTTLLSDMTAAVERFASAPDFETATAAFEVFNAHRQYFASMATIGQIRHTIDTKDAFYDAENQFYDENSPNVEAIITSFYNQLLSSPFRAALEAQWGSQLFVIAESAIKTFQPTILPLLQEENRLASAYTKRVATAAIEFNGKTYNISSIRALETDPDRATRRGAALAKWSFFAENASEIEKIYDDQVKVRHQMAVELGYKNFVELAYARLNRSDYNAEMVARFRDQVLTHIVPIASRLYERQRRRLGLDTLAFYDEDYRFPTGNPRPKGTPADILAAADKMYAELSPETDAFFQFMRKNELMDVVAKDGKAPGGYCTFIPNQKAPYIFSNFNGTSGDIDVLTHEAGHAFQVYSSRDIGLSEYNWPTMEACEIHSMSMEFFTWPWMALFFGDDTEKYHFAHLTAALQFLPYGVAVDEFQHFVYEHPEATPSVRNEKWREIEKKYLPHRQYEGHTFLESGGFWQKQGHIFSVPFYYIDYTLAQICAFQFWKKDRADHTSAWADYLRLCQAGGSQSFLKLVEQANLRSPFDADCVASVIGDIAEWLDQVDDTRF